MGKSKEYLGQLLENVTDIAIQYDNGDVELMKAVTELESFRKPLEKALEIIKVFKDENINYIEADAKQYPEGFNGYMIEVRNGGKIYNYRNIAEWKEAEDEKKKIEKKYKSMYEAFSSGNPNANVSEDGEVLELPEIKYRKSSVILKEI